MWRAFPDQSWAANGVIVSRKVDSAAPLGLSYTVQEGDTPLNAAVSAQFVVADWSKAGVGVVTRSVSPWRFMTAFVAPGANRKEKTFLRLGAIRGGEILHLAASEVPIGALGRQTKIAIECFGGSLRGELRSGKQIFEVEARGSHVPFAGEAGVLRLFNTRVIVEKFMVIHEEFRHPVVKQTTNSKSDGKWDVFVCHSGEDHEVAKDYAKRFAEAGLSVWIDKEQIKYGDSVTQKISDGLEGSKCLLVLLSKSLGMGKWVKAEYGTILNTAFSGQMEKRIVPIEVEPDLKITNIPPLLRDLLRVTFGDKTELSQLITQLQSEKQVIES